MRLIIARIRLMQEEAFHRRQGVVEKNGRGNEQLISLYEKRHDYYLGISHIFKLNLGEFKKLTR